MKIGNFHVPQCARTAHISAGSTVHAEVCAHYSRGTPPIYARDVRINSLPTLPLLLDQSSFSCFRHLLCNDFLVVLSSSTFSHFRLLVSSFLYLLFLSPVHRFRLLCFPYSIFVLSPQSSTLPLYLLIFHFVPLNFLSFDRLSSH